MKRCAVTGTNGKTSTVVLLASILEAAGLHTSLVCGLGASLGLQPWPLPDELAIEEVEGLAAGDGADVFIQEITSKALTRGWVSTTPTDVAVYTNLAADHFDVHGDAQGYADAKARLFEALEPGSLAILNADDDVHRMLATRLPEGVRARWFGTRPSADVRVRSIEVEASQTTVLVDVRGKQHQLQVPLLGRAFGMNAAAAATAALELGAEIRDVVRGLTAAPELPGRFSLIADEPLVVVDFAHNESALREALDTARRLARGRVLAVFGAGGDRMVEKRGAMGAAAAQLSDLTWVTSDNPRGEDPSEIAAAIVAGWMRERNDAPEVELHRPTAIARALAEATPDDVLLVAGMGVDAYVPSPGEALTTDEAEVIRYCTA